MVKSRTELLRAELERLGFELLDIYSYRDSDYLRVRHKLTGNVIIYESKRKINTLTTVDDFKSLSQDIARKVGVLKQTQ